MFEHLVGKLFKKSERAHAEQFHASGKSINEKVRLYARIGQALIEARSSGADAFAAIEAVLPWPKFESTVAEAQTLAQPEEFDYLALLDERYGSVRKFARLLLAHFGGRGRAAAGSRSAPRPQCQRQAHAARARADGFRETALAAPRVCLRRGGSPFLRTMRTRGAARSAARRRYLGDG
jgi:hypothetical protein